MTLFDHRRQESGKQIAPLATRMRPRNLEEYFGQTNLSPGKVLGGHQRRPVPSMILGVLPEGKTTLEDL
ncbi:MAG: hypothetical protein CM1200mP39_09120 [Dehalococcoidia bacterium]|nr:MAG: hypothetical protein CM1200mP39_09120 [Dehalococcoidia bacterium]